MIQTERRRLEQGHHQQGHRTGRKQVGSARARRSEKHQNLAAGERPEELAHRKQQTKPGQQELQGQLGAQMDQTPQRGLIR